MLYYTTQVFKDSMYIYVIDQLDEEHTRLDAVWVKTRQTKTYKYKNVDLIYIYRERYIVLRQTHTHRGQLLYPTITAHPFLKWRRESRDVEHYPIPLAYKLCSKTTVFGVHVVLTIFIMIQQPRTSLWRQRT